MSFSAFMSTLAVGSSRIMIFGLQARARAINTRCNCPPDREPMERFFKSRISTASIDSPASCLSFLLKKPILEVFPNRPISTVSSTLMGKSLEKAVNCGI